MGSERKPLPDDLRLGKKVRDALRTALADYVASEGCSCCRDSEAHEEAARKLAVILGVPKFKDGSGYDFWRFRSGK